MLQGNCRAPVSQVALFQKGFLSRAALLQRLPQQCLLIHNHNIVALGASSLWMHNLYLRVGPKPNLPTAITVKSPTRLQQVGPPQGKLWLTDTTVQSSGASHSIGLDIQTNSRAYLQGAASSF